MKLTIDEAKKGVKLKDIAVSVPKSLYSSKIFGSDIEFDNCYAHDCGNFELAQILNKQNPLISAWLVFSLVAICFLSPLLFIIH